MSGLVIEPLIEEPYHVLVALHQAEVELAQAELVARGLARLAEDQPCS